VSTIIFTVTNDLSYDQRMIRICTTLAAAGYKPVLVGRKRGNSLPLREHPFRQVRLAMFFDKGMLFYAEYNLRLFFWLLFHHADALCAIDLDTILPVYFVKIFKQVPAVYDAHEYFTEMKEVRTRPHVRKIWKAIERFCVPRFIKGYTVSGGLAEQFEKEYGVKYEVIRNMPPLRPFTPVPREKTLLFQGAVNEARGFEFLIPAMRQIPYRLIICGDGNFMAQLRELIKKNGVEEKIELKGMLPPEDLQPIAMRASLGLGLAESEGINQYYALPNKFTDYMHAGLPQLAMNYPEYQKINRVYPVAVLIDELSVDGVVQAINRIMENEQLLASMQENALKARLVYNWGEEEKKLVHFYKTVLA